MQHSRPHIEIILAPSELMGTKHDRTIHAKATEERHSSTTQTHENQISFEAPCKLNARP